MVKELNKILLHICCGVCASSPTERLRDDGFEVIGFFYNPNIHPQEEYLRRLEAAKAVADILKFELIAGSYDKDNWFARIKGLEDEPEEGRRCLICFQMRLEQTSRKARELGARFFATTLSVSPHKNSKMLNEIGKALDRADFLDYDFKKKDGFKKAMEFARQHKLFCQNYCGCVFSARRTC